MIVAGDRPSNNIVRLLKGGSRLEPRSGLYHGWYNRSVLPDLQIEDIVRLRKPHPCGSYDWKIVRLGADIGMQCIQCGRRVMLSRRELSRRLKTVLPKGSDESAAGR
ncbi:MAG TPA: DUF951 domain-containing protein [Anaerolineaceae bacterium]|nr:DUF951 domain-containing protein [Anaerolineaceae bacterium]